MAITPYSRPAEAKFMPLPYESMIKEAQQEYYMEKDAQRKLAAETGKALGKYTSMNVLAGDQEMYDAKKASVTEKFEDYYSNYGQNASDPKATMEFYKLSSEIENDPELRTFKYNKALVDKNREAILSDKKIDPLARSIILNKLRTASSFDETDGLRYLNNEIGIEKFDESKLIRDIAKSANMTQVINKDGTLSEEYRKILGPDGKVNKVALMTNKSNLPALSNLQGMVEANENVREKYNYLRNELGEDAAESYLNGEVANAIDQAIGFYGKVDQTKIGETKIDDSSTGFYDRKNLLYKNGAATVTNLLENTGLKVDALDEQGERTTLINDLDKQIAELESQIDNSSNATDIYKFNQELNSKKAIISKVKDINDAMKSEFKLALNNKSSFSNSDGSSFSYGNTGNAYKQASAVIERLKETYKGDPLLMNKVDQMENFYYDEYKEFQKERSFVSKNKNQYESFDEAKARLIKGGSNFKHLGVGMGYGYSTDLPFSEFFKAKHSGVIEASSKIPGMKNQLVEIAEAVGNHKEARLNLSEAVTERVLDKVKDAEQRIGQVAFLKDTDKKPFMEAYKTLNNDQIENAIMSDDDRKLYNSGKELTLKNLTLSKTANAGGSQMFNLEYSVKGSDNPLKVKVPVIAAVKDRVNQINLVSAQQDLESIISNSPQLQQDLEKIGGSNINSVDVLTANSIISQISPQLIPEMAGNVKFSYNAGGNKIDKHYKISPSRTKENNFVYKIKEVKPNGEVVDQKGTYATTQSVKNILMMTAIKHNRRSVEKQLNEKKKLNNSSSSSLSQGPLSIDSLLGTIKKESGSMSENAVAGLTSPDPNVSKRTVGENQAEYGNTALGEYQIQYNTVKTAFNALKNAGKLTKEEISAGLDNFKYTKANQKRLAEGLILHRGFNDYKKGTIDSNEFKFNLSQEWAMFPTPEGMKLNSGEISDGETSYWTGVGKNKSLISSKEFDKLFNS